MKPYYQDDFVTIYHGDWRAMDIDAQVILTDPPYGVGVEYPDFDDTRKDYWPWMIETVEAMRASCDTVVFTHRVAALRQLTGWDWVGVWNKPNAMSGLNQLPIMPHWEPVFLYGITGRKDLPRGFDVFSVNPAPASRSDHPTPKPVDLYRMLVHRFVLEGQTILDPFMGSGTTLRAAKDCGRRAIGVELTERFCELAARRMGQEVLDFGGAA